MEECKVCTTGDASLEHTCKCQACEGKGGEHTCGDSDESDESEEA
jgi:hypothetical protein